MKTLLVTGGAGFIGANFVHHWAANHPEDKIIVLDMLTYAGNTANIATLESVKLVASSIEDTILVESLLREYQVSTLVHFAAESHVDRSINGPDLFVQTNIIGTHCLLKAARKVWLSGSGIEHRFHHVSTDEVYGSLGVDDEPFHESTPYSPNSPYSATKAASDHLVRAYHHTYGLQTTTSNCSNNYGPYQFPEKLIPLFLLNALHGRNLPIYGDGMNVRDWLYVKDHCKAINLIIEKGRVGEVYNVGGGAELPNLQVIDTLCGLVDAAFAKDAQLAVRFPDAPAAKGKRTDSLKIYIEDRAGHDRRYAVDAAKISDELGYRPSVEFHSGLARTIDWYLSHEAWWQAILDGSYR
jgi:dTDP-glucose 4,6-dehydratase